MEPADEGTERGGVHRQLTAERHFPLRRLVPDSEVLHGAGFDDLDSRIPHE